MLVFRVPVRVLGRFSTLLSIVALGAAAQGPVTAQGDEFSATRRNLDRAVELLDDGMSPADGLDVLAELVLEDDESELAGRLEGRLVIQVSDLAMTSDTGRWLATFIATQVDGAPVIQHAELEWPTGAGGRGWTYTRTLTLPEEFQDAAVVVEDLISGRWGGTWVELTDEAIPRPPGFVVLAERQDPGLAESEVRDAAPAVAPVVSRPVDDSPVIQLVSPAGRPIVGRARFRTVVTTAAVTKAVFWVDDQQVGVDERAPFSMVIDLGKEARRRTIRVEAFGSRDLPLGEDSLEINLDAQPFRVAIRELVEVAEGRVRVSVDLSIPPQERLAKLEFYRNTDLVATLTEAPYEAVIESAAGSGDFVRVLASLTSGAALEDAQILAPGILSERVEVNLVEVYAVVTDRDGRPLTDLSADRFRLKQGRRDIPIERFALADEVPLVLGLIVDSSESMYPMMVETKMAAGQFFASTLKQDDSGFLVDFDTQPRLAQGLTPDLEVLLRGLRQLQPGGNTAIYDAAVFSLAQFERQPGRRALVLLTDGRDYGSRFGTKRCVQEARRLGVPLYVIVLNNLGILPEAWRSDRKYTPPPVDASLETLSLLTGGRLFNLGDTAELTEVYATINAELRSQYLLAFSTESRLEEKELASIEVEVEGKGLDVRTVTLDR